MTETEITIAVAKLGGWTQCEREGYEDYWKQADYVYNKSPYSKLKLLIELPPYLTSRDAIVPVIEKHNGAMEHIYQELIREGCEYSLLATPRQLCIALLKATGNYKE